MDTRKALVVLDVQRIYTSPNSSLHVEGSKSVLVNINRLIEHFETHRKPIIYTRHIHRKAGWDLGRMWDFTGQSLEPGFVEGTPDVEFAETLKVVKGAPELVKQRYSAFLGTELAGLLTTLDRNHLVVCGFMTNFCCETTARDAHDRDYYVDFVMDATGCPPLGEVTQDEIKRVVAASLAEGFARVMSTKEELTE